MWEAIKIFIAAFVVFMAIDFIWLGLISKNLYNMELGPIKKDKINWTTAIIFYVMYIAGLSFFVIAPALDKGSFVYSLYAGAIFGLVAYATYDLTNLAAIKGFKLKITVIDLIWGTFLTSATSVLSCLKMSKYIIN